MSLAEVVELLACPHCSLPMELRDRAVRCTSGHSFDVAKQGYVNLTTGQGRLANADSTEMVAARARFLERGHYAALADRMADLLCAILPARATGPDASTSSAHEPGSAAEPVDGPAILEAGAGTGYYLGRALDRLPAARGIATDLSPGASRRASRAHDRLGALVADTWAGLPVRDAVLDLIMVVFAPRNAAEFARVLRPGGRLVVVTAAADHLLEVRDHLGLLDVQLGKRDRLQESLREAFEPEHTEQLRLPLSLTSGELLDLISMGPNAHHRPDRLLQRIDDLHPPVDVTAAAELSVFRRRSGTLDPG